MPAKVIAHVNMHVIKHNTKHGTSHPTLTIKHPSLGTRYCHEVRGMATLVDSNARGRKPLSCGARVWIEYDRDGFQFMDFPIGWETLKARLKADREDWTDQRDYDAVTKTIEKLEQQASTPSCPLTNTL